MKKIIVAFILIIPCGTQAQEAGKNDYKAQMSISLTGGQQYSKYLEGTTTVYGLEFSLQCPLITPKSNNSIRQQFSVMRQEGKKHRSLAVEISPQYKMTVNKSFEFGAGPSAGFIFSNLTESAKPVFSYGLAANAGYQFKKFLIAFESRYVLTRSISFTKLNEKSDLVVKEGNLNNLRTFLKVGYKF